MTDFDGDEWQRFGGEKVVDEAIFADEGHGVGVMNVEELQQLSSISQLFKHVERHEKSHRPWAILIGQGDHHETTTWPNVQVTFIHGELEIQYFEH